MPEAISHTGVIKKGQKGLLFLVLIVETVFILILLSRGCQKTRENLNLKLQIKDKEQELLTKESLIKDLEKKFVDTETTRAGLETQVNELNGVGKILEGKLAGSQEVTETLSKQFSTQEKDIFEQFKSITDENKKTFSAIIDKIDKLLGSKIKLESGLKEDVQSEKNPGDSPQDEEISLGKITVQPRSNPPLNNLRYNFVGNILDVDNEYNFIIVDLGQENGVKPGSKFAAIRGQKKIGEIILKEVYKGMSLAEPVEDKTPVRLRRGDKLTPIR